MNHSGNVFVSAGRACIAACLLIVSSHADADGSVAFGDDAQRFLDEAPTVRDYLFDALCISINGMAARVAGDYPLGGQRIGPYRFPAYRKGEPNGPFFTLEIETWQQLFGKDGKPLDYGPDNRPPIGNAYRIEEKFRAVRLYPASHPLPELKTVNCTGDP
jgi:hypothetical protein